MREEYELEVLEQYNIEVNGTRRIRGAFFCDTNEGTMLLKETKISARRAPLLYETLSRIEKRGNIKVDTPVYTKDGELLVTSREGTVYMLKHWYQGRECDIRQEGELLRAAGQLARLHRELDAVSAEWTPAGPAGLLPGVRGPLEEIGRHNRELKKVRSFIRGRVAKNEFEYLYLESFEKMYDMAEKVLERMERSGCEDLYKESMQMGTVIHGDYNYHNLLMLKEGMAVTGFEHMRVDIQMRDLYYFMRKAMEKHHWKQKTGQMILEAYEQERPVQSRERNCLGLFLAYPEKFWKTAGNYYRSNKAWLPEKCVEKLELAVRQAEEKQHFLEEVFSLNI